MGARQAAHPVECARSSVRAGAIAALRRPIETNRRAAAAAETLTLVGRCAAPLSMRGHSRSVGRVRTLYAGELVCGFGFPLFAFPSA